MLRARRSLTFLAGNRHEVARVRTTLAENGRETWPIGMRLFLAALLRERDLCVRRSKECPSDAYPFPFAGVGAFGRGPRFFVGAHWRSAPQSIPQKSASAHDLYEQKTKKD